MLDVETTAGASDTIATLPTNAIWIRLLALNNMRHPGSLFPVLPSARPNPDSERANAPLTNIISPHLGEVGISKGTFITSDSTILGFEFGSNYNLRAVSTDDLITVNINCRASGTTYYWRAPRLLAGHIQTQLRASVHPLAATFVCTFSDERQSATPTYKWTISNSAGTFKLKFNTATDANTIGPSIGFTTDLAGASTYTGTVAIHTEESFVIDLQWFTGSAATTATTWGLNAVDSTSRWRWIVLLGCNLQGIGGAVATAGSKKLHFYLGTTLASVDNQPDSAYTENRDYFRAGTQLGVYEGADGGEFIGPKEGTAGGFPAQRYVADLKAWRAGTQSGANAYAPNYRYLRVRMVDPTNPNGHLQIGHMFAGPGWYPTRNRRDDDEHTPRDRSDYLESPLGAQLSNYRDPADSLSLDFISGNQLSENDAEFLKRMLIEPRAATFNSAGSAIVASVSGHPLEVNRSVNAGKARPIIMIDPSYKPTSLPISTLYARGLTFGIVEVDRLQRLFTDMHTASIRMTGASR